MPISFISRNWRSQPLRDLATIINLTAATNTEPGLKAYRAVRENRYPKGVKVTKEEIAALGIRRDESRGEWNHTLLPGARFK